MLYVSYWHRCSIRIPVIIDFLNKSNDIDIISSEPFAESIGTTYK